MAEMPKVMKIAVELLPSSQIRRNYIRLALSQAEELEKLKADNDRLRKAIREYLDCQTTNQWVTHFKKVLAQ